MNFRVTMIASWFPTPTKIFMNDLEALSAEPVDEDLEQLRVISVEPFEHVEGTSTRMGTRSLNIKIKMKV